MRLGAYDCEIKVGTRAYSAFGVDKISERHRHRYEVNNKYKDKLEKHGLIFSGINPDLGVVESIEIKKVRIRIKKKKDSLMTFMEPIN